MAQLVQEAALVAVRKGHQSILQSDVDDAADRLTVGPKRVGIELGHQGQCRRATTEVGVAMTSHLLRRYDNAKVEFCDRISIVPRGQVLFYPLIYIILYFIQKKIPHVCELLMLWPLHPFVTNSKIDVVRTKWRTTARQYMLLGGLD